MKLKTLSVYKYVKIRSRYLCLDQNPFFLVWLFYIRKDPFLSFDFNRSTLLKFLQYKFRFEGSNSFLELPFYGNICLPVHKGYKVFNLVRKVVVKKFSEDVGEESVTSEIEMVKKASKLEFAPSLFRWSVKERWYEEEYINGFRDYSVTNSLDSATVLKKYDTYVAPCIVSMIQFQSPVLINANDYISKVISVIEAENLSGQGLEMNISDKINTFISSIVERLANDVSPVYLVFTHGDLNPSNIINVKNGIRVVDWESQKSRSMLFDFFSYFFFRSVHQSKIPITQLYWEMYEALPTFFKQLSVKTHHLANNLQNSIDVYRWLYYLERVWMLLERKITDPDTPIVDNIIWYIDVFNSYEENFSGKVCFTNK